MHLLLVFTFMVLAAAQPHCDPETQYVKNDQCCKMCGPGTSMSTTGSCDEPQCKECSENEYQDTYTTEPRCQRQPYCDTNKNFETADHSNKKKRTICQCKRGFHCSSEECLTCVPHRICPPGKGAKSIGNHTHNTLCHECPKGTFSSESSWDGVCQKFTECGSDYHIKDEGTDMSDNICEKNSRMHGALHLIWVLILVLTVIVLAYFMCKGKRRNAEGKFKDCFKPDRGDNKDKEPLREVNVIRNPTDVAEVVPILKPMQEEHMSSTPEENEDDQSQDRSLDVGFTANGQCVQQEMGKTEQLSRQESQTDTLVTENSFHQSEDSRL
uniref:tumor necrosis factor receptor superfamily member 5 n=1 Tax=Semicossyphus pulcher TaxID=241346 RepID=UPI0037E8E151